MCDYAMSVDRERELDQAYCEASGQHFNSPMHVCPERPLDMEFPANEKNGEDED